MSNGCHNKVYKSFLDIIEGNKGSFCETLLTSQSCTCVCTHYDALFAVDKEFIETHMGDDCA